MTTCEREPPGTVTLTLKYLPHTYHAKRDGQEKPGCKYPSPCMQASATPHTDPWGKYYLLANIVSCLTYPKLHLEPHLKDYNFSFLYTAAISELVHSQQQSTAPNIVP